MALDFSEIDDRTVGYSMENDRNGHRSIGHSLKYSRRELKFGDLIRGYSEGKNGRWEVYRSLDQGLNEIDLAMARMFDPESNVPINPEDVATLSLKRFAISNAMQLMVDVYLSKGLINNEPPRKRL